MLETVDFDNLRPGQRLIRWTPRSGNESLIFRGSCTMDDGSEWAWIESSEGLMSWTRSFVEQQTRHPITTRLIRVGDRVTGFNWNEVGIVQAIVGGQAWVEWHDPANLKPYQGVHPIGHLTRTVNQPKENG